MLSERGADVALCDWEMPVVNGLELCRRTRVRSSETPYLYFILALAIGLIKTVRMRASTSPVARPKINVRLASRTPATSDLDLGWVRSSVESSLQGAPPKR